MIRRVMDWRKRFVLSFRGKYPNASDAEMLEAMLTNFADQPEFQDVEPEAAGEGDVYRSADEDQQDDAYSNRDDDASFGTGSIGSRHDGEEDSSDSGSSGFFNLPGRYLDLSRDDGDGDDDAERKAKDRTPVVLVPASQSREAPQAGAAARAGKDDLSNARVLGTPPPSPRGEEEGTSGTSTRKTAKKKPKPCPHCGKSISYYNFARHKTTCKRRGQAS